MFELYNRIKERLQGYKVTDILLFICFSLIMTIIISSQNFDNESKQTSIFVLFLNISLVLASFFIIRQAEIELFNLNQSFLNHLFIYILFIKNF